MMERHEVVELEWEKGGERICLKTRGAQFAVAPQQLHYAPAPQHSPAHAAAPASESAKPAEQKPAAEAANRKTVTSPFVGTFYRQPKPDSDPYVREGQTIKRGDVLCIVEAMKLMNEIEAEFPGKIVQCLVENGTPVEFGEPLYVIET